MNDALVAYRDGIQFVFGQTMAGISKGMTPDELVQQVQLPTHLAQHPYLQEWYGTVAWAVRGIYAQQVDKVPENSIISIHPQIEIRIHAEELYFFG